MQIAEAYAAIHNKCRLVFKYLFVYLSRESPASFRVYAAASHVPSRRFMQIAMQLDTRWSKPSPKLCSF